MSRPSVRPVPPPPMSTVRAGGAPKRKARIEPHGYEAARKIKDSDSHDFVDTAGLLMHEIVHRSGSKARDSGALVMATLSGLYPFLLTLYADSGYRGPVFWNAVKTPWPTSMSGSSDDRLRRAVLWPCRSTECLDAPSPG